MARKKSTFGVIGLGPVGSILTAHLVNGGENVVAEDVLENLLVKVRTDGLHVSGFTELTVQIDKTANSVRELSKFDPEIIFITTKACFLMNVLSEIKEIYKPNMKIVSFQNGLGNEQLITEELGIDTAYRVVINFAGNLVSLGDVVMNWFQPPNYIGALHKGKYVNDETTKFIANALTASGLKTEESPDIKKDVWEKTILNSALCSICALTGQTMKEAMTFEPSRTLAIETIKEGLAVAKADGCDFGVDAIARFTSYLEKGGAHKPSMLIDVEKKRPTEVDFISGAVVRYGEKYKIPTPVNSTLTGLIKALEHRYLKS